MTSADSNQPGDSSASDLPTAVAQILRPDGAVAGAGFLVAQGVVVTCAHVVEAAGGGPEAMVWLAFPHADQAEGAERQGHVPGALWRAADHEDVAFIYLSSGPAGARPLPLGSAEGCRGHQVRSFGFPAQAPPDGHYGFGVAGDLLPGSEGRSAHLQLTAANDLTTGFSGGPVLDEVTGLVIGMLTEIAVPDQFERGQGVAYVTPTQVLRQILRELAEQEVCPYRGLEPFTAEHARWFQGRQEAVRHVVTNLAQQRRLTLLLGPSGSGKSSLIQAGVLRALAEGELPGSDRWLPVLARPRQDLAAEIERAGLPGVITDGIEAAVSRRLEAEPTLQRILLIIDQFEELLTHTANGHRQDSLAIADQITETVDSHAQLSVILIMRDDFYPQLAAQAPSLLDRATPGILNIPGTLNQRDLHDIITLPAQDVGLHFQLGLPEQMVIDLLAATPEEASAQRAPVTVLPLLELTLSQLWLRRQDGYLTHDAYRRIGAISGSLTTWCDSALNDLTPTQRSIARRILTSLVHPADHSRRIPAVRAQRPLYELRELAAGPDDAPDSDVDTVMAALARHRIITTQTLRDPQHPDAPTGEPVAELIHDALIRDWGKLNEWVRQDHRFHEWLDRTRERQTRWAAKDDPGDLLGGTALAEGLDWAVQHRLPADISAFLVASKERQQAVIRRGRRINKILATLLAVVLLAVLGGASAFLQWQSAIAQRQAAVTQRQAERSQRLASRSDTLIEANPKLASLLAIKAYQASHTPESIASLRTAAAHPLIRSLTGHVGTVDSLVFSPDGRTLATASSDRAVRLWDTATGKAIGAPLTGHTDAVESVAFSPDGRSLATASDDRTVRVWDVATRETHVIEFGHTDTVASVAVRPDGRSLATASSDGTVRLWDVITGKAVGALVGHIGAVVSVAFSPDGHTLASAGSDGTVRLWDVTSRKTRAVLIGHASVVQSVAFSSDGRHLATASNDLTTLLWDATTGKPVSAPLIGHTGAVQSVAFSPNGQTIATGSADHTVRLWDAASGRPSATLVGHTGAVWSVAFSPDGHHLATASDDRSVRLWDVALSQPAVAIASICRTVERDITPRERTAYLRYLPDQTWPACPPTS
ncbi:trypsin-like peptidase domain-containing protein [Streptomyces sp. NPDC093060]|uniref:nSTAND1 domain-containing NTPase n=1 Tax=Streptomyces sp. NPDC093060 TaxID=3366019 RepID=UPI00380C71FF